MLATSNANAIAGALSASGGPPAEGYPNDPSFFSDQDRDDYNLGRQHLAHLHKRADRFSTDQIVAQGRAVREQQAAAREAERQRLARIAEEKARAAQDAERRAELNAANAAREEAQRREALNLRNQQLAEAAVRDSFANRYAGTMHDVAAKTASFKS